MRKAAFAAAATLLLLVGPSSWVLAASKAPHGPPSGSAGRRSGGMLAAARSYLGLTPSQLAAELRQDKTLAGVAEAEKKSVTGLEQAIERAIRTSILAAEKAGRISTSQAAQEEKSLAKVVQTIVNRPFSGRLPFHGGAPSSR